jgi:uncharacterized membrane protein
MQTISVSGNDKELAFLVGLAAVATAIFWMVVGWRAMRAHERLADASEQAIQKIRADHK